jgi:acyl-CoA dehydrogenase
MRLAERESVQMMLGDLAMQIEVGRMLVMKAAWEIDRGGFAQREVSMAKIQVANLLSKAADVAIQINGARGYSKDTILEWIYRYARQARLVDGADEVHKMVLNRYLEKEGKDFWNWEVGE